MIIPTCTDKPTVSYACYLTSPDGALASISEISAGVKVESMKVEYVVLADGAQAVGGKLYILGGGWSIFYAQAFPAPINIGLGVNVSYTSNELGMTYPWSVTIADEAGIPIVPEMNSQVQVPQPSPGLPSVFVNRLPFAMQIGLAVPRPGKYTITVKFGSSTVKTDFDAIFVRAAPGASPPDMPEPTSDEPRN